MSDDEAPLAEQFERQRARLRGVAYRMLGSFSAADDAVQETWLRLSRVDAGEIENLPGWLTTVVGRVCLNVLRSRRSRPEELAGAHVPDPVVIADDRSDPAREAELADSVGLALLIVLDVLTPPERVAFVLHDMFGVSFEEIAPVVGRTVPATRQLASRARRRVQVPAVTPDADLLRQRKVVDAFFAAARGGDLDALLVVLDPDVVLRSDGGRVRAAATAFVEGAVEVAGRAITFAMPSAALVPVLVNGAAGVVVVTDDGPLSVMAFTVQDGRIVEIDILVDPERLNALDLPGGV
jgi:RNA polymerase sigma-70 factor (ECF subfamily)